MYSQFSKSSGIFPSGPNPGISACGWGFFGVPVSSQDWYSGLCGEGCCSSYWTAWSAVSWVFFSPVFLGLIGHLLQGGALK
jgi:hypothetical protein